MHKKYLSERMYEKKRLSKYIASTQKSKPIDKN